MSKGVGIPIKLLHEAEGHVCTVELKSGEMYRGALVEAEDNWNCQMNEITYTARDGRVTELANVFIRGSKIRFIIVPDMLKNAPMFKRIDPKMKGRAMPAPASRSGMLGRGRGRGRGRG